VIEVGISSKNALVSAVLQRLVWIGTQEKRMGLQNVYLPLGHSEHVWDLKGTKG
jgi:hypothetical protein